MQDNRGRRAEFLVYISIVIPVIIEGARGMNLLPPLVYQFMFWGGLAFFVWAILNYRKEVTRPEVAQQTRRKPQHRGTRKTSLLSWLRWHKDVVFLALGVIAIIVLGLLSPRPIEIPKPTFVPRPANTSAQNIQLSQPSPQEIFDYINPLHSYDQQQVKKNYEGRPVTWAVRFIKIESAFLGEGQQVVSRSVEGEYAPLVFFAIDIDDYSEFKTMATGQEFIVQGTITQVGDGWIMLDKCQLFFYQ